MPWQDIQSYHTSIDDLGGDGTNSDRRVRNQFGQRRPDGRVSVTERDQWAALVGYGLMEWVASFGSDTTHRARRMLLRSA